MGNAAAPFETNIPDHIPPELVKPWTFGEVPGAERDIHLANAALLDGPEIFYALTQYHGMQFGSWLVARSELIREVLQDPQTFTSRNLTGWSQLLDNAAEMIPLESDGRSHQLYRAMMVPRFSPKGIAALEAGMRQSASELIDACLKQRNCEFQKEFGLPFPVTVFLRLMGLPLDHMAQFLEWELALLQGQAMTMEARRKAAMSIKDYLVAIIAERRSKPTDDLISFIVTSKIEGRPLADHEALGMSFVLFAAGLDTVANGLGFAFKYLAENPQQQRLLRREPGLIPNAMEEMLRAFPPVALARTLTKDVQFHGVTMKQGDRISLPIAVSARDPSKYDRPNDIDFRRENTRHMTFSTGPHICIGSHLARREIQLALEEWLARVPEFHIPEDRKPVIHALGIWGVSSLPLAW
jgi:cytochrome P450